MTTSEEDSRHDTFQSAYLFFRLFRSSAASQENGIVLSWTFSCRSGNIINCENCPNGIALFSPDWRFTQFHLENLTIVFSLQLMPRRHWFFFQCVWNVRLWSLQPTKRTDACFHEFDPNLTFVHYFSRVWWRCGAQKYSSTGKNRAAERRSCWFITKWTTIPQKKKTLSKFVETRKNVKVRDRRSDTLQGMIYTFNMIFRMVCLVTFYSVGYGPDSFVVRIALRWLCVWLGFE